MPTSGARIPPTSREELDDEAAALLAKAGIEAADVHLFRTMIRHKRLFRRWLQLLGGLLTGELSDRDRELLILRTAFRCGNDYEWNHHLSFARRAGLTPDEVARVRESTGAEGWAAHERALLRAADELHDTNAISDDTWAGLCEAYSDAQLIEVPMVVGHYHMVGYVIGALGIELEPEYAHEND